MKVSMLGTSALVLSPLVLDVMSSPIDIGCVFESLGAIRLSALLSKNGADFDSNHLYGSHI